MNVLSNTMKNKIHQQYVNKELGLGGNNLNSVKMNGSFCHFFKLCAVCSTN